MKIFLSSRSNAVNNEFINNCYGHKLWITGYGSGRKTLRVKELSYAKICEEFHVNSQIYKPRAWLNFLGLFRIKSIARFLVGPVQFNCPKIFRGLAVDLKTLFTRYWTSLEFVSQCWKYFQFYNIYWFINYYFFQCFTMPDFCGFIEELDNEQKWRLKKIMII